MLSLVDIQCIGNDIALRWSDGTEHFIPAPRLRAASPSAENKGEKDLFGNVAGGDPGRDFSDVTVTGWQGIGGYAIQFFFSDGHSTGLYTFDYLKQIARDNGAEPL